MKQKIKTMKHKPVLSDDEIRSYMNFDQLMANQSLVSKRMVVKKSTIVALLVLMVGAGALYLYMSSLKSPVETATPLDKFPIPNPSSATVSIDTITSAKEKPAAQAHDVESKPVGLQKANANNDPKSVKGPQEIPLPNPSEDLYIQAEPLAGYSELYEYFSDNLQYPAASVQDSVQGVETVSFTINTMGKPEKILIRKSLGVAFDEESIRLIQNMPAWKPATLSGKPIPSQMSIPLTFQLEKLK